MPDWEQMARARLGRLNVAHEREAEIVAEIAAHLEDASGEALLSGAGEELAVQHALALVPDWEQLRRELSKEVGMNERLRTWTWASLGLGVLALLAVLTSHLALTDIYHAEGDVRLEWSVLRVCFAVIVVSQLSALVTLTKVLRGRMRSEAA